MLFRVRRGRFSYSRGKMAQSYRTVAGYLSIARLSLQDAVAPYRYPDTTLLNALNIGLSEMGRIRPDMFLDLKYQRPLRKGDIEDGNPQAYSPADIATNEDGSYKSRVELWCRFQASMRRHSIGLSTAGRSSLT